MTLEDSIDEIPNELAFNGDFVNTIRYIQLIGFEIAYRRYTKLMLKYPHTLDKVDVVLDELEKIKQDELEKLHVIINGHLEKEK